MSFATGGRAVVTAKGSLWDTAGVGPNGRSLPVRFSVLAVIYHLHRDACDNLPMFEQAGVWIFHEEADVHVMVDELQHLADQSVAPLEVSRNLGLRSRTTVVRAGRTRPDQIDVWGKLLGLQVQHVGHESWIR